MITLFFFSLTFLLEFAYNNNGGAKAFVASSCISSTYQLGERRQPNYSNSQASPNLKRYQHQLDQSVANRLESTALFESDGYMVQSEDDDDEERMRQIRSLQDVFYSSTSEPLSSTSSTICRGGIINNLPLYRRAGQTELPGRSTIVYVADPRYTHMFESIIRSASSADEMLVGQVYVRDGNFADIGRLEGWKDQIQRITNENKKRREGPEEVVIGTILRIVDYRRINDGRMVLLVHGLERFVIECPKQEYPYPIADIRIVPDTEYIDSAILEKGYNHIEARVNALQQALFENKSTNDFTIHHLPGTDGDELSIEDLASPDLLANLMPLAPFITMMPSDEGFKTNEIKTVEERILKEKDGGGGISVEMELVHYRILQEFPSFEKASTLPSCDELEKSVWITIDYYARRREIDYDVLPSELIQLLPMKTYKWPTDFGLEKYVIDNDLVPSSFSHVDKDKYDNRFATHRRQWRLSYNSVVLLGGTATSKGVLNRGLKQKLLEIPSTQGRLWAVLECFEEFLRQM